MEGKATAFFSGFETLNMCAILSRLDEDKYLDLGVWSVSINTVLVLCGEVVWWLEGGFGHFGLLDLKCTVPWILSYHLSYLLSSSICCR